MNTYRNNGHTARFAGVSNVTGKTSILFQGGRIGDVVDYVRTDDDLDCKVYEIVRIDPISRSVTFSDTPVALRVVWS